MAVLSTISILIHINDSLRSPSNIHLLQLLHSLCLRFSNFHKTNGTATTGRAKR